MKNNSKITVVIPVYNVEQYIEECIESVINQTYTNLEIILVDDGSTDNSGNICNKFEKIDKRIKVIHKANGGLSDARNIGLKVSTGEYIQFIDSDDYIEKDMIETLYKTINEYNADIAICNHYVLKNGKTSNDSTGIITIYNNKEVLKEFLLDTKIRAYTWEKLWKKSLFEGIEFPFGRKFEDIATTPKLFWKAEKIVLNDIPKYYYRQREGSIMNKQSNELRLEYIDIVKNIDEEMKKIVPELEEYFSYNLIHAMLNTYNDIAIFKMYDLIDNEQVKELYKYTKKLINNEKVKMIIEKNMSEVKKLHLKYILEDVNKYINLNKNLPLIYPEHEE